VKNRTPEEQEEFLQAGRFGEAPAARDGPLTRLAMAALGLVAGNMALFLFPVYQNGAFILYGLFSFAGWILVGVPIALLWPARVVSRLNWLVTLLIGSVLGPLALFLIAFILTAVKSRLSSFNLDNTGSLWPVSIVVSTVAFATYRALLARR